MAQITDEAVEPPSYNDSKDSALDAVFPPTTLYFAGHHIHSGNPQAPPLYQLVCAAELLRDAISHVTFERLDYTVKDIDGTPKVSTRKRPIFDLKHPTLAEFANFEYQGESTSRSTLCSFGLSLFRPSRLSSKKGWRIHRAARGSDRRLAPTDLLFTATPAKDSSVAFEWTDSQGRMLAREVEEDDAMTLVITAEIGGALRDALAAAWVARLWWDTAQGNNRRRKWEQAKRIITDPNPELIGMKTGYFSYV